MNRFVRPSRCPFRPPFRRGVSLIETVLVLSIFSMILTVATTWIVRSLATASASERRGESAADLRRLANDLRPDIHRCDSATIDGDTLVLRSDPPVRYVASQTAVRRRCNDQTRDYSLPNDAIAVWQIDDDLVTLRIERARGGDDRSVDRRVVARVGVNRRDGYRVQTAEPRHE